MKADVTIFEMGPRDGLQNESKFINTFDKIKLVNLLSKNVSNLSLQVSL